MPLRAEIAVTSKLYRYILLAVFTFFIHLSAYANCSKSYTVGFFNGVWNTRQQASDGKRELQDLIGTTYNNEPVKYANFYNHTGSSVGATALQDIAETFIQRSAEIDASGELGRRFEYFWEFIGSSKPTFIDKIKGIFSNAVDLFDSLFTAINTKLVAIISYFTSNPPTESDYVTHNAQLDALAADGQKLMLVGHSQGNLFMNHGYDHILPTVGVDRVAAAHIAPASPTLRGDYILANIDLVINAMRLQGVDSVPGNNLDINVSRIDVSGHTLIGTYLDGTRDGRGKVKTMIETGMGKLKCISFVNILNGLSYWSWEKRYLLAYSCADPANLSDPGFIQQMELEKSLRASFDISDEFGEYVYKNESNYPSCLNNIKEYYGDANWNHYGFIAYSAHYEDGSIKTFKEQGHIFYIRNSYLFNYNLTDFSQLPINIRHYFNI